MFPRVLANHVPLNFWEFKIGEHKDFKEKEHIKFLVDKKSKKK